jgi:hypothetical protein
VNQNQRRAGCGYSQLKDGVPGKCGQNESNIRVAKKILESNQKVGDWEHVD